MFENRIIVRLCFETKFVISFVDSFFFFFSIESKESLLTTKESF